MNDYENRITKRYKKKALKDQLPKLWNKEKWTFWFYQRFVKQNSTIDASGIKLYSE